MPVLQSGILTSSGFAQCKFIHAAEPSVHLTKGLSIRLSNLHSTETNSTAAAAASVQRRRPKLTPTASASLLRRPSVRQSNPIHPSERPADRPTDRPTDGATATARGADFFFHRDREGEGEKRRRDERCTERSI